MQPKHLAACLRLCPCARNYVNLCPYLSYRVQYTAAACLHRCPCGRLALTLLRLRCHTCDSLSVAAPVPPRRPAPVCVCVILTYVLQYCTTHKNTHKHTQTGSCGALAHAPKIHGGTSPSTCSCLFFEGKLFPSPSTRSGLSPSPSPSLSPNCHVADAVRCCPGPASDFGSAASQAHHQVRAGRCHRLFEGSPHAARDHRAGGAPVSYRRVTEM